MAANRLEITVAETTKTEKPKDVEAAEELSEEDRKAIHDAQVPPTPKTGEPVEVKSGDDAIAEGAAPVPVTTAVVQPKTKEPKVKEKKELPVAAHNESFYATLDNNANGIPTVSVLPKGWVGPAPLQIGEAELEDLIAVLTKLKR